MSPADNLPTTQIEDGNGGFIIINSTDFDPNVHTVYTPSAAEDEPGPAPADLPEEPALKPLRRRV